jgi:hypothetical protein
MDLSFVAVGTIRRWTSFPKQNPAAGGHSESSKREIYFRIFQTPELAIFSNNRRDRTHSESADGGTIKSPPTSNLRAS